MKLQPDQVFRDEVEFSSYMEQNPELWDAFLQQVIRNKEIHCLRLALFELTQSDNIATAELALNELERSLSRCPDSVWDKTAEQRRAAIDRVKAVFPARKIV